MKIYKLHNTKIINTDMETCWDFFSNPNNLKKLTPEKVFHKIDTENFTEMYPGMIITYIVKPVLNIKFRWVTEITQMEKYKFFIDEQRFGPYKFWHHQHFFRETETGIEVKDIVHYALPFGIFGSLTHKILVQKELQRIFDYRNSKLKLFFEA